MGRKLIDLTGQRFGRLVVETYLGREHHSSRWRCRCDCGRKVEALSSSLKSGETKSCGCWRRERMGRLTLKHGERGRQLRPIITPEYRCWLRMLERCSLPTAQGYKWYGGRGIKVCKAWAENFGAFLRDVGRRPGPRYSIDRIDGNKGYEPGNCRWVTWRQQARNRSNNRVVTFRRRRMTLIDAAELAGIRYRTVKSRLGHGWSVHRALTEPVNERKRAAAARSTPGTDQRATGQRTERTRR